MKTSTRTQPRIGEISRRRRRKKKSPDPITVLRIEWIEWLIEQYGVEAVSDWQDPPVTFAQWKLERELAAHEAA